MGKIFNVDLYDDIELLLQELQATKMYDKSAYNDFCNSAWLKGRALENCLEANRIKNKLEYVKEAVFFVQPANTVINPHTDKLCKCSLNILLNDADAPIIIDGEAFRYKCALIDVNRYEHEVPASSKDRLLLRYTFSEPFEVIKPILSNLS